MNDKFYNTYIIKKGDTLYGISEDYNTNPDLLAILNGLDKDDYIYPGQSIKIPLNNVKYYITKDNDTINELSNIFGVKDIELLKQNNSIYLLPGQMIFYKER